MLKVTLFLTTYNWPEALYVCLKSIASQTLVPDEVIVADDGSRESTKQVVEQFGKNFPCPLVHVWQEDNGYRINALRNKAIARSSHPYIIQIDGDVICDKNFVKDHIAFAQPNRLVVGRRINVTAEQTHYYCENLMSNCISRFRSKMVAILHQNILYDSTNIKGVRGCNMAYWRDDAFKVNGYEEDMIGKGPDDKEFAARMVNAGVKVYNLKFYAIINHLHHGDSDLRNNYLVNQQLYFTTTKQRRVLAVNGLKKK